MNETVKLNPANPIEVARETLRRLAMQRIAPTPDNYQNLYHEIAGTPTGTSAASVLENLVQDLQTHHPELSGPTSDLQRSIRQQNWTQCRKLLGDIALQLKNAANGAQGDGRPQAENVTLLRDLLSKTLEFGVVTHLTHEPQLVETAQQLSAELRSANSSGALREVAAGLKTLWVDIELRSNHATDRQDSLKRILLLLVENIGELLDDDTWLRGQLDMVQEVIAGPMEVSELQEAEKRLKEVIYKQSMVKHGLREATSTLKNTMKNFVSRLGDAVAASDDYQEKIAGHVDRISGTDDVLELNHILENLLEETRTVQTQTRRTHDDLMKERDVALQAESRIQELESKLSEMSALVREDPMTGSLNRRGMDDEFAREAARSDRYGSAFSVAVIDIDNFKKLNDSRGHHAGDEALIHLVKVVKDTLRISDHVARMGGEEFLVMLPNTNLEEAAKTIERTQRALTKKFFLDQNDKVLITFSAGVAERVPGEPQDAVIARADAAMYEAKQTGKNRVCIAPAPAEKLRAVS